MDNIKIVIRYSDGSKINKTIEAIDFGDACKKAFDESNQKKFIVSFIKKFNP